MTCSHEKALWLWIFMQQYYYAWGRVGLCCRRHVVVLPARQLSPSGEPHGAFCSSHKNSHCFLFIFFSAPLISSFRCRNSMKQTLFKPCTFSCYGGIIDWQFLVLAIKREGGTEETRLCTCVFCGVEWQGWWLWESDRQEIKELMYFFRRGVGDNIVWLRCVNRNSIH